jgi:superfamily II DNA or RNA helicase
MSYRPNFIIDENVLTIYPSRPQIEKWLTYKEKSLRPDGSGDFETTKEEKAAYWVREYRPEGNVISTWQGLWKMLMVKCLEKGWTPILSDVRDPFPEPKLHLMHGFRFSQKRITEEMLRQGWSGILSAPTRWGKTYAIVNTIRAYPDLKTVVIIPGEDLGKQLYDDLVEMLPGREVKLLGFGSSNKTQGKDVTVCSMDSMDKLDHSGTRLVLIDEVHALPTDGRLPEFGKFLKARKLGFGATSAGRFDNRDIITEGAIGPVLSEITYKEARAEGSVAPITVFMLRCPYDVDRLPRRRDHIYKEILWGNNEKGALVSKICHEVIPADWQTLAFIPNEKAASHFQKHVGESSIAMAKLMTSTQRKTMMNAMQRAQVTRCIATKIYAQGVTFPDLRVCINLNGGGANTFAVQMAGRVAQVRKDIQKRCGVVIDFLFEGYGGAGGKVWGPTSEAKARHDLFVAKGYDVCVVNTLGQLKEEWARRVV